MAADDDPGLSLAKLQIVDTTPPTLRCSDCHRLAVGAVKLPCCKANICHTCSVILYDTCPVCAHRSVTRGDCKPNKELREAVRAHRSTDREKYGAEHREEIERRKAEREKVERARAGREANRRNSGCIAAQREEEKRVAGKREQERRKRVGVSRRGEDRGTAEREVAADTEAERCMSPSKRLQPTPVAVPSIPLKECGVCTYDVCVDQCIPITPTEDVVCFQCFEEGVKPLFEKALLHEHEYPARWGATTLDPTHFAKLLHPSFATKWIFRQREYDRPAKEKVYCRHLVASNESSNAALKDPADSRAVDAECSTRECGRFLGIILPPTGARSIYDCIACKRSTCGICAVSYLQGGCEHVCIVLSEDAPAGDDPYKDMKRGKDYQLCPKCDVPDELEAGCNFMTCRCRAWFCYICGIQLFSNADAGKGNHFEEGKPCPRWNQPGSNTAHYDISPVLIVIWRTEAHRDEKTITLQDLLYNLNAYFAVKLRSDQTSGTQSRDVLRRIQTLEALRRLVFALHYILQFHLILAELPRFDPINEDARDEYFREVEQIEYLAANVTTPAALQCQQAHALHPIIASALTLYRERHESFVEALDAQTLEARAAGRLRLATLDRLQHDPAMIPLRRMRRSALANATSDPVNAHRWHAVDFLLFYRKASLQILMIIHFLPQLPSIVEHYFAEIHRVDAVIKQLTANVEAGPELIQQPANGLVDVLEARDLLNERYNELVERVQPAIVTATREFASKEELTHIKPAIVTATGAFAAPDVFAALQHA
ncbi:hypothetical protein LTR33_007935 [Friedmanniomyces endolithicus]|nr:hypothetical protein LTR33_007935 [Friedmanniomyces endolithicus]